MTALTASIGFIDTEQGRVYQAWLIPEDGLTDGDDRLFVGPIEWRDSRIPLTFSTSEGEPHEDARLVGSIDNLRREMRDGESWLTGEVDWDTPDPVKEPDQTELVASAKRLVDEDRMRGISVHPTEGDGWLICGVPDNPSTEVVMQMAEEFDVETCERPILAFTDIVVGSATLLMLPAFDDAEVVVASEVTIAKDGVSIFGSPVVNGKNDAENNGEWTVTTDTDDKVSLNIVELVEAVQAATDLKRPPADWFTDPQLKEPTPLTITEDGRVFGHLALWDTCHRGFDNTCITPPKDATEYAEFHDNARVMLDTGELLGVGCLTVDVSHADVRASAESAKRHYDHSGTTAAFTRAGVDEVGVWLAGAVAPWATEENIEKLRRLSLSGDWRPKGGSYFLIAAQAVPVPGFPIRARVASGIQVSLTTVGPSNPVPDPLEDMSELGLVATALQMTNAKLDEALAWIRPQMEAERQRQYEEALAVFQIDPDHPGSPT